MPATPGLVANLRQLPPEEPPAISQETLVEIVDDGQDVAKTSDDGAILEIKHPDGSLTISLDGRPINDNRKERDETDWYRNLVDDVAEGVLNDIAQGIDAL